MVKNDIKLTSTNKLKYNCEPGSKVVVVYFDLKYFVVIAKKGRKNKTWQSIDGLRPKILQRNV